jgi:hypothetical protein
MIWDEGAKIRKRRGSESILIFAPFFPSKPYEFSPAGWRRFCTFAHAFTTAYCTAAGCSAFARLAAGPAGGFAAHG